MNLKKLEYILKHNTVAQKLYVILGSTFFRVIGLFVHKKNNLIVFSSLIGKSFSDSPKVLFEAMKDDERFTKCTYVWAFEDVSKYMVDGADVVALNSIRYFIKLMQATIWINNVAAARNLQIKPRYTTYLNTMHGVSVLKKDGNAQKNRSDYNRDDVDFQCTCCEEDDEVFLRDFSVRQESIVRCGMPRNDYLYTINENDCIDIKIQLGLPTDKKVILYAPTWRDNQQYGFELPLDLNLWRRRLSQDYVLLIRMHHLVMKTTPIQFDDFIIDGTVVEDANELLPAIDILITDYSSIALDFSILERPVYSFAYDLDEYQSTRGSYLPIDYVFQGNVFMNEDELLNHITSDNYDRDVQIAKNIKRRFMPPSGNATNTCLDFLATKVI